MRIRAVLVALVAVLCARAFAQEAELFAEAEGRYAQKQYTFALALYDEFLEKHPLSERVADAQYRRAVSLYRLGRYRESLELLSLIQKRYRSTAYIDHVPFWQGIALYSLGDYTRSIDALRAYLGGRTDPELARQALVYEAVAEVASDRLDEAAATLDRLGAEASGGSGYAAVLRAYVLLREERYQDLVAFAQGVAASGFDAAWRERFNLYHAEALWETGRTDAAEELYRRLLDSQAETASVAVRRLFVAASRRNDVTSMEDLVQYADTRFAGSPEILKDMWVRLGVENYARESFDLAESILRRVWNLRQHEEVGSVVALHLAEIYLRRGERERAVGVLLESLELGQKPSGPLEMRLGDFALGSRDFAGAEQWYARFLSENAEDARRAEATYLLAFVRYRLGKHGEALEGVESYLASPGDGKFQPDAQKLRVILLQRLNRLEDALAALTEVVRRYPGDVRARVDMLKLLFTLGRYGDLLTQSEALFRAFPGLDRDDPYAFVVARYLQGLALISARRYESAAEAFAAVREQDARAQGLAGILPDLLYYHGWALYRSSRFDAAAGRFLAAAEGYPDSAGAPRALYMAGFSNFAAGRFTEATSYFRRVGDARGDSDLSTRAAFYVGKSLLNAGSRAQAIEALKAFVDRYPASELADDALLDYGLTLGEAGQVDAAIAALARVVSSYPSSPLAEEATYQRAQVFYRAGRWTAARDAFTAFRNSYPRSSLYDAALYWGGLASLEAGEKLAAQLLWEKILIPDYPESPFRPDAIWRSVGMATDAGDYDKALKLTVQLITDHPEQAKALNAEQRAGELRYLILGLDKREAELSAVIERERGVATRAGREAMIALARVYLAGDSRKLDLAFQLLAQVADRADPAERSTGDTAQYLLGEYFYRKGDPARARDEFLKSALRNPADRDLAASGIFRAAEMSALTGRKDDVAALVKRLTESFPSSQWAQEGKRLLEDAQ